jgi:hypothetical protein
MEVINMPELIEEPVIEPVIEKQYSIVRYEKNKDYDGNITSIFLAVSVSNGQDDQYYEYWLSDSERDSVLSNGANIVAIINKCMANAEISLDNLKGPKPPELMTTEAKLLLESQISSVQIAGIKANIIQESNAVQD